MNARPGRLAKAVLLGLSVALLVGAAWVSDLALAPADRVGQRAPGLSLKALSGTVADLDPASLAGRVWLLNVWASWCAPCREEHAMWVEIAHGEGLTVVGLNVQDDPRAAEEWLLRGGDPYRFNAIDVDGRVASAWGTRGVPQTFMIDVAGVVRYQLVGPLTRETWVREMRPLLRRLERGERP